MRSPTATMKSVFCMMSLFAIARGHDSINKKAVVNTPVSRTEARRLSQNGPTVLEDVVDDNQSRHNPRVYDYSKIAGPKDAKKSKKSKKSKKGNKISNKHGTSKMPIRCEETGEAGNRMKTKKCRGKAEDERKYMCDARPIHPNSSLTFCRYNL
jgi:hypothetical protein